MTKTSLTLAFILCSLLVLTSSQPGPLIPDEPTVDAPIITIPDLSVITIEDPFVINTPELIFIDAFGATEEEENFFAEEEEWALTEHKTEEDTIFNEDENNIEVVNWDSPPVLAPEPSLDGDVENTKPVIVDSEGNVVVTSSSQV